MLAPLLISEYQYVIDDRAYDENAFFNHLSEILMRRYERINALEKCEQILSGKGEEEILDIYREVVKTDKYGYLIPNGTKLMNLGESERKLNELIGLDGIKEAVTKIKTYALLNKDCGDLNLHMCFLGNPGSGKTEVARIIAGILYENRILPTNNLIEVDRSGLVSQYFGATAEKTSSVIARAMGGVLFIDEAYSLADEKGGSYGDEAINTIVQEMENRREDLVVIFAGYPNEMETFLNKNPGLRSRIAFHVQFADYDSQQLCDIARMIGKSKGVTLSEAAIAKLSTVFDSARLQPDFGNGRYVRNVIELSKMNQAARILSMDPDDVTENVLTSIEDVDIELPAVSDGFVNHRIGFAS